MNETLSLMYDAAFPPSTPYPGARAAALYIGGNALRVATASDWLNVQHLTQFPIWVGAGESDPTGHAAQCVSIMKSLGFEAGFTSAFRRAVLLDFETEVDPAWVNSFGSVIWGSGYSTLVYGSESTIVDNPAKEGRWIALYDNRPDIPPGLGAVGHQFRANVAWDNTQVDLSVITDAMMARGGIGPRHVTV